MHESHAFLYANDPRISPLWLVNDNEVNSVNLLVTFSHEMINDTPESRLVVSGMSTLFPKINATFLNLSLFWERVYTVRELFTQNLD